jgi:hypothetical protein
VAVGASLSAFKSGGGLGTPLGEDFCRRLSNPWCWLGKIHHVALQVKQMLFWHLLPVWCTFFVNFQIWWRLVPSLWLFKTPGDGSLLLWTYIFSIKLPCTMVFQGGVHWYFLNIGEISAGT